MRSGLDRSDAAGKEGEPRVGGGVSTATCGSRSLSRVAPRRRGSIRGAPMPPLGTRHSPRVGGEHPDAVDDAPRPNQPTVRANRAPKHACGVLAEGGAAVGFTCNCCGYRSLNDCGRGGVFRSRWSTQNSISRVTTASGAHPPGMSLCDTCAQTAARRTASSDRNLRRQRISPLFPSCDETCCATGAFQQELRS